MTWNAPAPALLPLALALVCLPGAGLAQPTEAQINAVKQNCRSDFMSKCSGVKPGGPEAVQCLKKNATSPGCRAAVDVMGAPAQAAPAAPAQATPPRPPAAALAAPTPAPQTSAPAAPQTAPASTTPAATAPAKSAPAAPKAAKPKAAPASKPDVAAVPPVAAPAPVARVRSLCRKCGSCGAPAATISCCIAAACAPATIACWIVWPRRTPP